ncbi:glycoside hydrolase superfamily [Tribonema minus]|uniref:Glycoside hydrolase superfamily n=1 Tax=Tribonema minus TaxID=303371 RepID=A0A835YWE9_9STRA|nr:glycoside hydrolase superfamily [Tribonema minus]
MPADVETAAVATTTADGSQSPRAPFSLLDVGIADILEPVYREEELNAQFQVVTKFGFIKTMRYPFLVKNYLDQGFKVVLVVQFLDTLTTNLKQIGDGLYDKYLYKFADELIKDGNREVWVRPMHEFNGDWYPWGTYMGGTNTIQNFIRAYRHVYQVLTAKGANIKFQLGYNCVNGANDKKTPFSAWWPGDDVVDMVVCSAYNRAGTDQFHTQWQTWPDVFQLGYDQMAALPTSAPLGVGEMGTVGMAGEDKAGWIRDAFAAFPTLYPRVEQITWFLEDKDDGEWDLNSADEIEAFRDSLLQYTPQGLPQVLPAVVPLQDVNGDGLINTVDAPPFPTGSASNSGGGAANSDI